MSHDLDLGGARHAHDPNAPMGVAIGRWSWTPSRGAAPADRRRSPSQAVLRHLGVRGAAGPYAAARWAGGAARPAGGGGEPPAGAVLSWPVQRSRSRSPRRAAADRLHG